ncbi:MAG TPA: hypothetical protein VGP63_30360 [Planctomycetaceae bacterium]|jgi:hypothetical protein|nr:hypothetical protein [Planctomycetaceae bacterium]
MWSLLRGEPDQVIRWAGPLILCGMTVAFLSARLRTPGLLSAFQVIALGAMGGSLVQWRTERGLWMLAGLFFVVWSAIYGLCLYGEIHDIVAGAQVSIGLTIDAGIAMSFYSTMLRFLWRVTRENWRFSVPSVDA